jgi:hypothetical protein
MVGVMSVEVIGRLMAGSSFGDGVRSTSGAVLSKAELAGVLSGLDCLSMDLAFAKWGCDASAKSRLVSRVADRVCSAADKAGWLDGNVDICCKMASLAVDEVVSGNLCPRCRGVGVVGIKVCNVCDGTKHKALSGRAKAERIGVTQVQWCRVWSSRYEAVYKSLNDCDARIKHVINRAGY